MKTREFEPEDGLMRLPNYVINDLLDKGYSYVTLPSGKVVKVTKEDILFKEEELLEYVNKIKNKKGKR